MQRQVKLFGIVLLFLLLINVKNYGQEKLTVKLNNQSTNGMGLMLQSGKLLIPTQAIGNWFGVEKDWGSANAIPLETVTKALGIAYVWDEATGCLELYETFNYKGMQISFEASKESLEVLLGEPSLVMHDGVYDVYFYYEDYANVLVLYLKEERLYGFCTVAEQFTFRGISYGDVTAQTSRGLKLITDSGEQDQVVGMGYQIAKSGAISEDYIKVNERIIAELTNGFRIQHNKKALTYDEQLADVARAHCVDMAQKDYVAHVNLEGLDPYDRIKQAGIRTNSVGENIAGGVPTALENFGLWINSPGHRKNLLNQTGSIGVGGVYEPESTYRYYYTQNFAVIR